MTSGAKDKKPDKITVASNRKARFHYEILEVYEAGLSLKGPEVKSLRASKATLEGSFARVEGPEVHLHNLYIAPYAQNTSEEISPTRTRKLLLRRKEIDKLRGSQETKGLTLVPLEIYFKNGWAKISLALAKGKRGPDKRESLRKKDAAREMERSFKGKFKV
jgi:SsrA-binding protein